MKAKKGKGMHGVVAERERVGLGTATVERLKQAGDDGSEISDHGIQRIIAAPLDRLHRPGHITKSEYFAGDKFRTDCYLAGIDVSAPTVDWASVGGPSFRSRIPATVLTSAEAILAAKDADRNVRRRLTGLTIWALDHALVREHSFEEMGQALFGRRDKRDATVAGQTALRMALNALADHYRTSVSRET